MYNQTIRNFIAGLNSEGAMFHNFKLPIGPTSASPELKRAPASPQTWPELKRAPSPQTLRTAMAIASNLLERANNSVSTHEKRAQDVCKTKCVGSTPLILFLHRIRVHCEVQENDLQRAIIPPLSGLRGQRLRAPYRPMQVPLGARSGK